MPSPGIEQGTFEVLLHTVDLAISFLGDRSPKQLHQKRLLPDCSNVENWMILHTYKERTRLVVGMGGGWSAGHQ